MSALEITADEVFASGITQEDMRAAYQNRHKQPQPKIAPEKIVPKKKAPSPLELAPPIPSRLVLGRSAIGVEPIFEAICEKYGITIEDLKGPCKIWDFCRPRQVAMFLAKDLSGFSYPYIGRRLGGRDHTTIINGVRKIAQRSLVHRELAQQISELRARIEA